MRETFSHALRLVFFTMLPCMIGLIVLREPITALLFQRGAFGHDATRLTADALLYYGLGLWAFSAMRIVLYAFYALQDTRTPVKIAVVSILANAVVGVVLMGPMGPNGLALALSLSSAFQLGLLLVALRRRMGAIGWRGIGRSLAGSVLCSLAMGGIVWVIARALTLNARNEAAQIVVKLPICIFAGVAVYGILASIFRRPELSEVKQLLVSGSREP
jgi:putative peptidoglycan lipid II flippase